jgi:hypothetical protein
VDRVHREGGEQTVDVAEHRLGRQLHGARGSGGSRGALQDRGHAGAPLGRCEAGGSLAASGGAEVEYRRLPAGSLQQVEFGAVAEDRAHAKAGEPGQRCLRPILQVGAADWTGQDRHALAGQPNAVDGGHEIRGRLADQPDRAELRLVVDALGEALGAGVDQRPRVPGPGFGFPVEDHQIVS